MRMLENVGFLLGLPFADDFRELYFVAAAALMVAILYTTP
jgi:hypothetical protein